MGLSLGLKKKSLAQEHHLIAVPGEQVSGMTGAQVITCRKLQPMVMARNLMGHGVSSTKVQPPDQGGERREHCCPWDRSPGGVGAGKLVT